MKLVEILARKLHVWPEGCTHARRSVVEGSLWVYFIGCPGAFDREFSERSSDEGEVVDVTKDQWEAERARIANDLQEQARLTNSWQKAIDHELVIAHLGVAEMATEDQARVKLHELIDWHVSVATNPATNGGLVLSKPSSCEQELWDKVAIASLQGLMPIYWDTIEDYGSADEMKKCHMESACEYADAFMAERAKRMKG